MRLIVLVLTLVIAAAAALADSPQQSGKTEQKLTQIEQEILDNLLKGDTSAFEKYVADGAQFTGPDGSVSDKAGLIGDFKSGQLKIESSKFDNMKVQLYGNTAVVTYGSTDKSSFKGKDISGRYRWMDVFVNHGGQWKIVAEQGTRLEQQ